MNHQDRPVCPNCHHVDCLTGTAEFQQHCAERAAANERINRMALQRRGERDEAFAEPVDELTAERAINERLRKRVVRLMNVVEAAALFVAVQAPLAQGDFAGDMFTKLEHALAALVPKSEPGVVVETPPPRG